LLGGATGDYLEFCDGLFELNPFGGQNNDKPRALSVPGQYRPFASLDDELGLLHYGCVQGVRHHVPCDWEQKMTSRKMRRGRKGGNENTGDIYIGNQLQRPLRLVTGLNEQKF